MPLILLRFPSVPNPVGAITKIVNAKEVGAQGMTWAYENQGGFVRGTRSYTNTLRVITNSPFVGPIQVQQALIGIGAVQGSFYRFPLPEFNGDGVAPTAPTEQDTGSFLHSIEIRQEAEDAKQWLATFSYGPFDINHEIGSSEATNGSNNPLEKAPEATWTGTIQETSYPNDINGVPFLNTVGDPIENPPKREESRQTLTFIRNEATYNENYAQSFRQTVNLNTFLEFPPGCAKCKMITGKRIYTADFGYYWEVVYEFEFRVIKQTIPATFDPITGQSNNDGSTQIFGFQDRVLNAGFRQIVNGNATQITVSGSPVSSAVALSSEGVPLNIGVTDNPDNAPEPFFLTFNQYFSSDFDQLNIPPNVLTTNQ